MILQWCKMQILCLLILIYVGIVFIKEGNAMNRITKKMYCNKLFDLTFIAAEFAVLFDGITACTVNLTDRVPHNLNLFFHLGMFVSYELFVTLLFWYWISVTVGVPKGKGTKAACLVPTAIIVFLTAFFLPDLDFIQGEWTNYSMGNSVYVCFGSVIVYILLTVIMVIVNHRNIPGHKKVSLATTLIFMAIILSLQVIFPEALISCMSLALIIISIYLNMENPTIHGLEHYHDEMIMGFATLVENKDDSTGGHIRRSSAYAKLIAKNLQKTKKYKNVITRDYLNNLGKAAPMHDVGKIGIPDAILQKPDKLTPEEYEQMKKHAIIGGNIIRDTFGHLFDSEYENMAYQVARYHHEKWNGKGYPEGISKTEIPLCARIMAVADVFDAVSAKRCYRDAMPLEKCYEIIQNGRGTDFDPDIVDAFMMDREEIETIYRNENW